MSEICSINASLFNAAMFRLISRADLENYPISRAIVAELLRVDFIKFGDLHLNVCNAVKANLTEKHLRQHIKFTNEKFRMINNLDIHEEVTLAQIYDITVEVNNRFFTRIALVHNIRPVVSVTTR